MLRSYECALEMPRFFVNSVLRCEDGYVLSAFCEVEICPDYLFVHLFYEMRTFLRENNGKIVCN